MADTEKIAKYAVIRRLGTGGMAEVFKCHFAGIGGFDKVVVVKRILPHLAEDEEFVAMFLDEARIAANLNHPNVVQVYEIDQDQQGSPFIAMEFVKGPTFTQLVRAARKAGPLPVPKMVKIISGIAQGLQHAHEAVAPDGSPLNIIHRDVSPHNVMVSVDGVPKLLDFGVARANGRLTHTRGRSVKGKARYIAPELLLNPEGGDARCDVFSLGVCLYATTTGIHPFEGQNETEIMEAIAQGRFRKPSEVIPTYPADLEDIVLWALCQKPDLRCPSAKALAERLDGWLRATDNIVTTQDLSKWVHELFPAIDDEAWGADMAHTPSGNSSSKSLGGRRATPSVKSIKPLAPDLKLDVPIHRPRNDRRNRLVAVSLIAVVALGAAAWLRPRPAPSAKALLDEARHALITGNLDAARSLVEDAREVRNLPASEKLELKNLDEALQVAGLVDEANSALTRRDVAAATATIDHLERTFPANGESRRLREALERLRTQARPAVAVTDDDFDLSAPGPVQGVDERPTQLVRTTPKKPGAPPSEPTMPTAPTPPPPSHGSLKLSSPVPAKVSIDGRPVGVTPLELPDLSPGDHLVAATAEGHQPFSKHVTVTAGNALSVNLELVREKEKEPEKAPPPEPEKAEPPANEAALLALGSCPEDTTAQGSPPPAGREVWCANAAGVRHGRFLRWYPNGQRAEDGAYFNGKKNGVWIEYFEDGAERDRMTWRRGVKTW